MLIRHKADCPTISSTNCGSVVSFRYSSELPLLEPCAATGITNR